MSKANLGKKLFIALTQFILIVAVLLSLRWFFYEPFVIPSGSMIPTLLVHDHILVQKNKYGIRYPFSQNWLGPIETPNRGDVVVFRSMNGNYFMVKRVIGLPGETVSINPQGVVAINHEPLDRKKIAHPEKFIPVKSSLDIIQGYNYFLENDQYIVRFKLDQFDRSANEINIPEGHLFLMGDNRDNSSDSRFWGLLPVEKLLGQAQVIWLSCEQTLADIPLCLPTQLRTERLFTTIK